MYTNKKLQEEIPQDESFDRIRFLAGRYERSASEFYNEYVANNLLLMNDEIKRMSRLTENFLHGIDYNRIMNIRTENYHYLDRQLRALNRLKLREVKGAFAYPLLLNDAAIIRRKLIQEKIYIPILWPNVLEETDKSSIEYDYASNILPIPIDQRYDVSDMKIIVDKILQELCN